MRRALLGVVVLLLVLTGCSSTTDGDGPAVRGGSSADGFAGTALDPTWPASSVALSDTDGDPVRLDRQDVPLRLVFFGYTNCPDICQVVMSTMAAAVTRLPESDQQRVEGVFVTTDPARDTATTLRAYLDRFDPRFVGLTGPLADVIEVASKFHIFVEKGQKLPSGGYEVTHGTHVVAVRAGHAELIWDQATSPGDMAADIKKLLQEDS
ncbi:MAG TPA: SCO family protein [Marmoricola sp.]|nr:SCO family protein [Marmoricola sp.]